LSQNRKYLNQLFQKKNILKLLHWPQEEINSVVGDVLEHFAKAGPGPEVTSQFLRSVSGASHGESLSSAMLNVTRNLDVTQLLDDRSLQFVRMFDQALSNLSTSLGD
jgi:hypothetical protein